jgi:hypothetical protein
MTSHETFPTAEQCISKIKDEQTTKLYEFILESIYAGEVIVDHSKYSLALIDVLKNLHSKGYKIIGGVRNHSCSKVIKYIDYDFLISIDFTDSKLGVSELLKKLIDMSSYISTYTVDIIISLF